jgi:hypothetical protein
MIDVPRTTCITPGQLGGVGTPESDLAQAGRRGLLAGMALLALVLAPIEPGQHPGQGRGRSLVDTAQAAVRVDSAVPLTQADFGAVTPSPDARQIADWVARSHDNVGMAFVIVDKRFARLHVFDAGASLLASSPILLGAARGDDSVVGIGHRPLDEVRPEERTTPAGRFVSERGRNSLGDEVVWVDYEAAVSMHRVRNTSVTEQRLLRMASSSLDDHRISWGCINVPVAFFDAHIAPMFVGRRAVVYVLPEVKSLQQVFKLDDRPR